MLEGLVIHEAVEVLCKCTGHCARSPGTRAIQQALWPLLRKALHPFSERGIGQVAGRRDGVETSACHDLTDGLRTAKDPGLLGLFQDGLSGRQRLIGKVAFQGAHCFAPWGRRTFVSHVTYGDTLLIGA